MKAGYTIHNNKDVQIAEITADVIISNGQVFLDIVMNQPADRIIIHKNSLDESFFDLRSGLAGEILQKVVNYRMRLGIVGRFDGYESKSLKDFMFESNRSNTIVFVSTIEEAMERLSM